MSNEQQGLKLHTVVHEICIVDEHFIEQVGTVQLQLNVARYKMYPEKILHLNLHGPSISFSAVCLQHALSLEVLCTER